MFKKTIFAAIAFMMLSYTSKAASHEWNENTPMGFATCKSMSDATPYAITGGEGGKCIVLKSNGKDMRDIILRAIEENDIIVFDGSDGEFIASSSMVIREKKNKTIMGINNATIRTAMRLTPDIHMMLDSAKVLSLSTNSHEKGPFTLPNGRRVGEECEAKVRELLISRFNDTEEHYRESGLFALSQSENIIIRNLTLVGPGAIDVGGNDLLTITHHTRHVWVDHCDFIDGMDGNFDINGHADLITVSWCRFAYTDRTYQHANTNLIGSNDRPEGNGEDALNVTYYACIWDHGCAQRMPMVRFGTIHLLNCLYDCPGAGRCINPRRNSEVLAENCYFSRNVVNIFGQTDAKSYEMRNCVVRQAEARQFIPEPKGKVNIPYKYNAIDPYDVPEKLRQCVGPTLNL